MRRLAAVGAAVVVGGVAAGCSSSGSGTAASAGTSSTSSPSAAAAPGVAAAKAFIAKYSSAPTAIGNATPLPKAAPKGATIAYVENDNPQTQYEADGFKAAAKAIGWNLKIIPYKLATAPGSFVTALQTALQEKPYAVVVVGNPEAVWQNLIPAFAKAQVYIIPSDDGPITTTSPWVLPQYGTPDDSVLAGKIIADSVIADSNGTGQAVLVNVPDIPVLAEGGTAAQAEIAKNCPACKVTTVNVSLTQFVTDGGVSAAVSALQRNPGAKYLLTEQGASDQGVPSALAAANLKGIKLAGFNPSTTALQYVKDGTALGFATTSFGILGWMGIDIAAQKMAGVATPDAGPIPIQFLTQSALSSLSSIPQDFTLPSDYAAQYEKKWLVS